MVSFTRGQSFSFGISSDDFTSTSSSSSSLSFRTLHRLEAFYVDGVYHAKPLTMSHFGEAIEEGNTAITFGSPLVLGAFRQQRRILTKEVEEEEEKEELTRLHL